MEVGLVRQIDIDVEMQQSYLDYAMSVIIARALPDARDGLKPVHRRILHSMHTMGIRPDSSYKKSARIVGEVLGKYHPHGDMAVYEAMARMAQTFSMRYLLIDGQGNFGSIDGDPPAAMRYTEAKLAPLAMEVMSDLEKDTVAYIDNFDGSLREPTVLPCAVPNLLVNGATGIAVGMSTAIPPHNMVEVCDALTYMLDNWSTLDEISVEDLMNFIPGPDFPTGGIILRKKGETDSITAAYASGRGKITLQARTHIEEMGRGRSRIIVTELPYQTNKASLIEKIAHLARAGGLEGLADLRDESDREGMRIVLELSKTADPEKLLASLYRRTPMQSTVSVIMLALVDGEPRMLTLKQALRVFLDHRLEVVKRRSEYDLARAKEREHILAGLRIALKNLDEVIQLIRSAKDAEQANTRLQKKFELREPQARAILDMPLRRLSSLERKKIDQEYKEIQTRIKELESLLRSPKRMRGAISQELSDLKTNYGDRRRTQIAHAKKGGQSAVLTAADLAPDKETWAVITKDGKISRTPTARLPRMSGSAAPAMVIGANTRDTLYLFDSKGNGAAIRMDTIPESDNPGQGKHFSGVTPLSAQAELTAGIALPYELAGSKKDTAYLVIATSKGVVKKIDVTTLPGPAARSFAGMKIARGDALGWVALTNGGDDIIMITSAGMSIRFSESDVRPMGLSAAGVQGIRLDEEHTSVVMMAIAQAGQELLLISEDGLAKRSSLTKFPVQGRRGKGVLAWKSGEDVSIVGGAIGEQKDRAVVRFNRGAPRSVRFSDAPRRARTSSGNPLFEVKDGTRIIVVSPAWPRPNIEPAAPTSKTTSRKKRASAAQKKPPSSKKKSSTARRKATRSSKAKGSTTTKASTRSSKKKEG